MCAARSLSISVVIYPARPDLDRHGAKLSRVAFVGCRLEADTVAMFDALTRRTGARITFSSATARITPASFWIYVPFMRVRSRSLLHQP